MSAPNEMAAEAVYAGVDLSSDIEVDDLCDETCCPCDRGEDQTRLLDGRVVCLWCRSLGSLS